jgi:hypothetical protein
MVHLLRAPVARQESKDTLHVIEGNLGLLTRESYALTNSDTAPASFWISSPDNVVRSNRAAGSAHTGFRFSFDDASKGAGSLGKVPRAFGCYAGCLMGETECAAPGRHC